MITRCLPATVESSPQFGCFVLVGDAAVANLDHDIRTEILPYLKRFSTLPSDIQIEAQAVAAALSPVHFFSEIVTAWEAHNALAFEIDAFLCSVHLDPVLASGLHHLPTLKRLISEALATERRKRVFSAAVKPALERHFDWARRRYALSDTEFNMIITPSKPSFWISYDIDHLRYLLCKADERLALGEQLINKYHARSWVVLSKRLERDFASFTKHAQAQTRLTALESAVRRNKSNATESFYLTLWRPDLRAIRSIVEYDNCDEYEFGSNHFGVPDLYLRRLFVKICVSAGLLPAREGILCYSDAEIQSANNALK